MSVSSWIDVGTGPRTTMPCFAVVPVALMVPVITGVAGLAPEV